MITLITGAPGHGKTLYAVSTIFEQAKKEGRTVYAHNLNGLQIEHENLEKWEEWFKLPDGAIMIFDECQRIFKNRSAASAVPAYISEFETHRHHGFDIFLITQFPNLIDAHIRHLVGKHIHVFRPFGLERATIFEFPKCVNPDSKTERKNAITTNWSYPKEFFDKYKSSAMHTVKKEYPKKIIFMGIGAVIALAIALYMAYQTFNKVAGNSPAVPNSTNSNTNTNTQIGYSENKQTSEQNHLKHVLNYTQSRTPEIVGLPHTAQRYEQLTNKAVRARIIKSCYSIKNFDEAGKTETSSFCECRDQDSILLRDVPRVVCEAFIADGGIFYDHLPDGWRDQKRADEPLYKSSSPSSASSVLGI